MIGFGWPGTRGLAPAIQRLAGKAPHLLGPAGHQRPKIAPGTFFWRWVLTDYFIRGMLA